MLLIGSRAASFHLRGFRKPLDWDFIVPESVLGAFYKHPGLKPVGRHDGPKRDFSYGRTYVEVEVALPGSSAEALLEEFDGGTQTPFGACRVASLDALFLLKRSHIGFRRMWSKHFKDYQVLQAEVGCVPARLEPVLALRIEETKRRLRFKDRDFSVSNDEFFGRSADRVFRAVVHDDIHEVVKFGDAPLFKALKDDVGRAYVSFERFQALPFDLKVRNMQEECMVLTLERFAIPARLKGQPFKETACARRILQEMCFNFLPFDFRAFCVDYFDVILGSLPRGFAVRAMDALGIASGGDCRPCGLGRPEPVRPDALEAADL